MAEIRSYLKEREKRQQAKVDHKADYEDKIRRHRFGTLFRVLAVVFLIVILAVLIIVQYQKHIYTSYDTVHSFERETVMDTVDVCLGNSVLTYSKDGAHCTDLKGNILWNQTYEIQDVLIDVCDRVAVLASYNGRDVFVVNDEKILGSFTTNLPIRKVAAAANGRVVVVMADTNATYYNTYSAEGKLLFEGMATMSGSGEPMYLSLSPNGELMQIAYIYLDAGVQKTNIVFYNLGSVGANTTDNIVSTYEYTDVLIPYVEFMNNETAFAVGDNLLLMYHGGQKPDLLNKFEYNEEVRSVYYNENYVGLVFFSESGTSLYEMKVFNTEGQPVGTYEFDLEYTDIIFHKDNMIIYNDAECLIMTQDHKEKYKGSFDKSVRRIMPMKSAFKYLIVTNDTFDTIQLK